MRTPKTLIVALALLAVGVSGCVSPYRDIDRVLAPYGEISEAEHHDIMTAICQETTARWRELSETGNDDGMRDLAKSEYLLESARCAEWISGLEPKEATWE